MSLNESDFIPGGLSGNIQIVNKNASFAKTIVADAVTEGNEKFVAKLRKDGPTGNIVAESNVILITDTSTASPLPTYNLSALPTTVNEGSAVTFTLTTTNLATGANVPFVVTGISSDDVGGSALSGNFTIGAGGIATKTYTLAADSTTEGTEIMSMSLVGIDPLVQVNILINDISQTPANQPSYALTASTGYVSEGLGNSVTINLQTVNVAAGNIVPYTITGVSSSDIGNASLTGSFTVSNAGTDFKVFDITPDRTTEGIETLVITLDGIVPEVKTSFIIYDSSQSDQPATYTLTANVSQVSEGDTVRFTLLTTNVPVGAKLPYTITGAGITTGDFKNNSPLTGVFTVDAGGIATLDLPIKADETTEGNETLTLTLDNTNPIVSASVVLNDTSKTPRLGYALSANKYNIDEGETVTFTLTTIGVTGGTTVAWNITGIDTFDINNNGPVSGFFTVPANDGVATTTAQITIKLDEKTEGDETMIFALTGKNVSVAVRVRDTSLDPIPEYSLTNQFIGVPNYIDTPTEQTINQWYRAYLGRDADEDGLGFYTDRVSRGLMTLNDVKTAIQMSPEALAWDGIQRASEGQSVKVNLTTANVAVGTSVPYTITGIASADIGGGSLTGSFIVSGTYRAGNASITLPVTIDNVTESTETVKLALNSITPEVSTTFQIYDTAKARVFGLSANVTTTDEDKFVRITLTTAGVRDGTIVPFSVHGAGVTADDLSSTRMTWNATQGRFIGDLTVNNNTDYIDVYVEGDNLVEGPESFTLTLTTQNQAITVNINDTSVFESGSASTSDTKSAKFLAALPKNEVWVAFRMLGAGGAGGGSDGQPNSGFGYVVATDGAYTSFLNSWGIWKEGAGASWTDSFQVYFPSTGSYIFQISTDNNGYVEIDGANRLSWNSFQSVGTSTIAVSAGFHSVTVSATNTGGPASVGVTITAPGGYIIWTTREYAENGGGAGGPGGYIEGIVKLPKTSSKKYLFGAAGEPGRGGSRTNTKATNDGGWGAGKGTSVASLTSGSPSAIVYNGSGGKGAGDGPGGSSGGGGGGGGASTLFFGSINSSGQSVVTNIATAGGGGGGGGGSWRTPLSRNQNANPSNSSSATYPLTVNLNSINPTVSDGVQTGGDGGGGGGGGGFGGQGGAAGNDGGDHGKGGGAGAVLVNTDLTWVTNNGFNYTASPASIATGSTRFATTVLNSVPPQPFNFVAFGRGGPGLRPWVAGVGGQRGAIALYWQTGSAPTLSQVPPFPWPGGTVSLPDGDPTSGIVMYSDGNMTIGGTAANWHSPPSFGIGEFYQFRFTQEPASSGTTEYSAITAGFNAFGEWVTPFPYGYANEIKTAANAGGNFNLRVQIRRRDNNTIVADKVYANVSTPAPAGGGGCCVVATALTGNGKWAKGEKEDLIEWCERKLHGNILGETFRRGYQVIGSKLVVPQIRKGGFMSKYWNWGFTNAARSVQGKKFNPVSVPNTLFWAIWAMVIGSVVSKKFATRCWTSLYKDRKNGNDN